MTIRIPFSELAGEKIGESGNETIYRCTKCGKNKLYINMRNGLWICFVCGLSGRVASDKLTDVLFLDSYRIHIPGLTQAEKILNRVRTHMGFMSVEKKEAALSSLLSSRNITWWPLWTTKPNGMCYDEDTVYVPLHLSSRTIGVHIYKPKGDPRYKTIGTRGLWITGDELTRLDKKVHIFLFEGLFDLLAVQQLMAVNSIAEAHQFIFTAGDRISVDQFTELVNFIRYHRSKICAIHIMFDNDKIEPMLTASMRLEVIFPDIRIEYLRCRPPRWPMGMDRFTKDWDEVIKRDPICASGILSGLIGGSDD